MPKPCSFNRGRFRISALCAVLLCAGGCKSLDGVDVSDEIEFSPGSDAPSPIDSASTRGLEVRLWVVDDTDWAVARLLANQTSMLIDEQTQSRWADWGFRLVAIPVGEVEGLLAGLRPVQPINVQWLGEFGKWRAIIRTGNLRTDHVRVGQGTVQVVSGRPRLIARSWIEPMFTDDDVVPGLRLDFGVQIETRGGKDYAARLRDEGYLGVTRERTIEDEGPVFDELLMSVMFDGSQALVIVGDAPETSWSDLPEPASLIIVNDSKAEGLGSNPAFGPSASDQRKAQENGDGQVQHDVVEQSSLKRSPSSGSQVREPSKPRGKTLGEIMLTSGGSRIVQAGKTRVIPKRVIVVLIPRVEGGFELVPKAQGVGGRR